MIPCHPYLFRQVTASKPNNLKLFGIVFVEEGVWHTHVIFPIKWDV